MATAILVDAAFFLKRARKIYPKKDHNNPAIVAQLLHRYALLHLKNGKYNKKLYRIFIYDCPPLDMQMHNPISKKLIDFSKTDIAKFRNSFHEELKKKRLVALRLGHIQKNKAWKITGAKQLKDLISQKITITDIKADDILPDFRQKGVDIKIGIDIASIAYKQHADQIILIAGDSDFVPAAKLARREGIDFILDPMWNPIMPDLFEHIDGLRSHCRNPNKK